MYVLVLLALLLSAALSTLAGPPVFPFDDAYITLHNAQAMWQGTDVNYPGTAPLHGATSAIHLALVAALLGALKGTFLGAFSGELSPLWALHTAMWMGIAAYVLGVLRLASVHQASALQAFLLVACGLVAGQMPHQLLNGLETGWALAALVWALVLLSEPEPRRTGWLALLCGQLPFLRPELAVVSLGVLVLLAWRTIDEQGRTALARRLILRTLLIAGAGAAPWLLWYGLSTGVPYPSTIAAKRAFFAESQLPALIRQTWVLNSLSMFVSSLGLFSLTALLLVRTRAGWLGLVFIGIFVGAYVTQFPGALAHYEQRYLYVLVPFLLYAAASCWSRHPPLVRAGVTVLLALSLAQSLWQLPARLDFHRAESARSGRELDAVADWCRRNLPPHSVLLIHDAGYLAYATRFKLLDMVGLKTPASTVVHRTVTWPSGGDRRGEAIHRIAEAGRPDYLVVQAGWDRIFSITPGLQQHGWRVDLQWRGDDPDSGYRVYKLTAPHALTPFA